MENENAIQVVTADKLAATYFNPAKLSEMKNLAVAFYKAQCFGADIKNEYQALAKIQAGYEMGLAPMEAMGALCIINGKITIYGMAMVKKLRQSGWALQYDETSDACKVTINKGPEVYSYNATLEEIRKLKSKAIEFATKDKLRWHAIARLIRFYVPEVLTGGVNYLAEEIEGETTVEVVASEKQLQSIDEFIAHMAGIQNLDELNQVVNNLPSIINTVTITADERKRLQEAIIVKRKEFKLEAVYIEPLPEGADAQEGIKLDTKTEIDGDVIKTTVTLPEESKEGFKIPDFTSVTLEQMKTYIGRATELLELEAIQTTLNGLFTDGLITATVMNEGIDQCNQRREHLISKTNV